jgi:hypothetical protein
MTAPSVSAGRRRSQGPLMLADELYCVSHDDQTGRSRLHPRVLGTGLAAALLGELVLFGRVEITGLGEVAVRDRMPPPDALARQVLALLLTQPQRRDVRTWLAYLASTGVGPVAQRLVAAGLWRREEYRRLGRTRVSYLPVDPDAVCWRAVRLAGLLASAEPLALPDVVLAGLVALTGLTEAVFWQPEDRAPALARAASEVGLLPGPLLHLLAHTEAALGDAVLTPR